VILAFVNVLTVLTLEITNKRLKNVLFFKKSAGEPRFVATAPATAAKKSTAPVTGPAKAALLAAIVPIVLIIRSTVEL
jgi:hypothetical protein